MYYKLVSVLLPLAAVAPRPAAALELACNTTTKLGTEALKYSRITHEPAGWTIVHTLKNGERRDRAQQYRIADLSGLTSLGWNGAQYDNPALIMHGELRPTMAGYYIYTEDLRDAKRYDLIIAQTQATCWELSALKPAPTPPASVSATVSAPAEEQKAENAPPAHDLKPTPADSTETAAFGAPPPTIEDLPQYKFARAVEDSPVAGGKTQLNTDASATVAPAPIVPSVPPPPPASADTATTPPDYLCKPQPATASAETARALAGAHPPTAPNQLGWSADAIPPPEDAPMQPGVARAAMLIASPDNPQKPISNLGSAVWSTIPPAPGQPASVAVKAEAYIPDLKMHATMTLRKNTDPTLQATHTIDLKFSFADGAPITGFKDAGLAQMRMEDSTAAEALTSVKVKISDVYFLIALAKGDSDTARNLDLMKTRAWFDFPLLLNDDRTAKVVFQKSPEGQAMLEKAFDAWKETPAAAPEQEGKAQQPLYQSSPDAQARPPAAEAPPPLTPGALPKSETQAPTPAPPDEQKAQNAPLARDLTPALAGDSPADVNPKPNNVSASAAAPAAPAPPAKAPLTVDDLPQYKFAREVEHRPVTGGDAESRYLTTVYGMIKSHLHETAELHLDLANRHGIVDFYVNKGGTLVGRKLVSSSGSPNLDIAVMAAITEAAPYPAPPNWRAHSLIYNFGKR